MLASLITASKSVAQFSKTSEIEWLWQYTSMSSITFSCRSSCSNMISRSVARSVPGRERERALGGVRSFLIATTLPVEVCTALWTTPNVPSPIFSRLSYPATDLAARLAFTVRRGKYCGAACAQGRGGGRRVVESWAGEGGRPVNRR